MDLSIPLAIVAAVSASLCFAAGSTVQGQAVGRRVGANRRKEPIRLSDLRALLRAPRWLAGLAFAGVGSVLNVTALVLAPVTVVQPLGVLAVPWSVIFAARGDRRKVSRVRWTAVAETVVGATAFTLLAATYSSSGPVPGPWKVLIAAVAVYAAAEGLGRLGAHGRRRWRSFFWATGGAFYYGLESSLVKTMTELVRTADWLRSPLSWGIALAVVLGALRAAWMIQQAYATGPSEAVVGALMVGNPVVAVAFGMAVLGEGGRVTLGAGVWMALAAVVAIHGIVVLSLDEPTTGATDAPSDAKPGPGTGAAGSPAPPAEGVSFSATDPAAGRTRGR